MVFEDHVLLGPIINFDLAGLVEVVLRLVETRRNLKLYCVFIADDQILVIRMSIGQL